MATKIKEKLESENLALWESVFKTDPAATKTANLDGHPVTSIAGQYMVRQATSKFGPVGIGWGWNVVEERYDLGPEIRSKDGERVLGVTSNHVIRLRLWFKLDGERGEVEQYGCTKAVYKTSYGIGCDPEAPKKSTTDAIKKCLSLLGFSGDVFMGLFDDSDYVSARADEESINKADDKAAEKERQHEERLEYLQGIIKAMETAQSLHELKKIHASAVRRLTTRKDDAGVKRVAQEFADQSKRFDEPKATETQTEDTAQ